MSKIFVESELIFDFTDCLSAEKYDETVPVGLSSVDFVVETSDYLYLVEVKNFEQSRAPEDRHRADYENLTDPKTDFPRVIGTKIKDSLLRKYAEGHCFTKPVIALLIMKQSELLAAQRLYLYDRILGRVPTGLNKNFSHFSSIKFDMPEISDTEKYGFSVAQAE
jgi:hypothetical protein